MLPESSFCATTPSEFNGKGTIFATAYNRTQTYFQQYIDSNSADFLDKFSEFGEHSPGLGNTEHG